MDENSSQRAQVILALFFLGTMSSPLLPWRSLAPSTNASSRTASMCPVCGSLRRTTGRVYLDDATVDGGIFGRSISSATDLPMLCSN